MKQLSHYLPKRPVNEVSALIIKPELGDIVNVVEDLADLQALEVANNNPKAVSEKIAQILGIPPLLKSETNLLEDKNAD